MTEETDVVVVGAGPSGLAVGACLRERGISFVMLERAEEVGSTWRRHYERLHLHTVKQFSALPLMPWPAEVPIYPSRAQVVDYLQRYSERFGLVPRFGHEVTRAAPDERGWRVETSVGTFKSRGLVIATGYNRVPKVPTWPDRERFAGTVVHSSEFKTGAPWKGKRALVVGIGNSGGEIALDLWEQGAKVAISVRTAVHVMPRDLYGIPAQVNSLFGLGQLPPHIADRVALSVMDRVVGDLSRWGLHRPAVGPATQVVKHGRIPLLDIGTIGLVKQGKITVVPGPTSFTADGMRFSDGRELPFDLVVLATGYRSGLEGFLAGASTYVDDRGYPRWFGAPVPAAPGLFFVGYRNPITGQLHDIAREAPRVARRMRKVLA